MLKKTGIVLPTIYTSTVLQIAKYSLYLEVGTSMHAAIATSFEAIFRTDYFKD